MEQRDTKTKKRASFQISERQASDALKDLIAALGYDLLTMRPADKGEIAERLSRIEGQDPPWTWRYVHNVIGQKIDASARFTQAVLKLLAIYDGADPLMVKARPVQVYAIEHVNPGTILLAAGRKCANPTCPIEFIPRVPWQRYHSRDCARNAKKNGGNQ
jgi:hypothetical protein